MTSIASARNPFLSCDPEMSGSEGANAEALQGSNGNSPPAKRRRIYVARHGLKEDNVPDKDVHVSDESLPRVSLWWVEVRVRGKEERGGERRNAYRFVCPPYLCL